MGNKRKQRIAGREGKPKEVSWHLRRALETLKSMNPKDLSLVKVCTEAKLSKCYLSHNFARVAGCSFDEYKARRRIEEGKRLLVTTDLTVGEISDRLGCCRQDVFARNFKAVTGFTPSTYRNYQAKHGRPPRDRGLGAQRKCEKSNQGV